MDDFNIISVENISIEHLEAIEDKSLAFFRKKHPDAINRISGEYNKETNTAYVTYYSDLVIDCQNKKYYAHSKVTIMYEPSTLKREKHDLLIDALVSKMAKFGGWLYSSVEYAINRKLGLDRKVERGYGY